MVIRDLELYLAAVPTIDKESTRSLIVRLVSHTGAEGWGEATLSTLRQEDLQPLRNRLLPMLMGRSVFDLEELVRLNLPPVGAIRFGIETACWDIMGRITRQPICHLLGGKYRSHIPLTVGLTGRTHAELLTTSQELANRGYHWQTLRLKGRLEDDLSVIEALLGSVKHRLELRVDAGGLYAREDCGKLLAALEKSGISLLIDPLRDATPNELSALQTQTSVPIGVRSGMDSARDVLDLAAFDNLSWLILEPHRLGGLLEMRKCADIAEAAGLHCSACSFFSTGPAMAATAQLVAAMPALSYGIHCYPEHLETGILQDKFDISDGLLHLPHGPAIGMEIDRVKLEQSLIA